MPIYRTGPKITTGPAGLSDSGIITRPILPLSQSGELIVVDRTPVVELNSSYGLSAIRDVQATTNNGTITATSDGEIKLSTSATASGTAHLDSSEAGRYIPGYTAELGIGIRVPTAPTGNMFAIFGGMDVSETDGFYFKYNANGLYAVRKKNTSEVESTEQASWNIDPLDGTGRSGYTLDMTDGNIFQIQFTWYGYGQIVFGVLGIVGNRQTFIPCHSMRVTGSTSIDEPNLVIHADIGNGGDASNFDVYVGGRQYSILGKYMPIYRYTGHGATGVSTSTSSASIVSMRAKSGFKDRSIKVDGVTVKPTTEDVIVELYLNDSLGSPSWGTPTNATAAETALEADTSGTLQSDGTLIWSEYFEAGQANKGQVDSAVLNFDIPQQQPITLAARTLANTGTIAAWLRIKEEW